MLRINIPIWSKLTRLQRLLLAVVAVVVVLFALSTSLGGRHGDGRDALAEPPGFVQWMGDLFGESARVDPADLGGNCPPTILVPDADATLEAAPPVEPSPSPAAGGPSPSGPPPSASSGDAGRDLRTVDESCVLTVAPRDGDLRHLTVHAFDAIRVDAPLPHRDERAAKNLAPGEEVSVSVDAEGAEISLTCIETSTCSVELT